MFCGTFSSLLVFCFLVFVFWAILALIWKIVPSHFSGQWDAKLLRFSRDHPAYPAADLLIGFCGAAVFAKICYNFNTKRELECKGQWPFV